MQRASNFFKIDSTSRKSPFFVGLFLFCLLSISCTNSAIELGKKPVVDVDGITLNAKEFADLLGKKLVKFDALGAKSSDNIIRAKEEIIQDFVMHSLMEKWATKNDISIGADAIEAEINKIRAGFPDDLSFRRELVVTGLSFQQWKNMIERTLLEKAVFQAITKDVPQPTEEELLGFYNSNKEQFKRAESVYLRQILLKESSDADSIKTLIKTKPFEELAKTFSIGPEAKSGGLIGWIEKGAVDYFEKAFSMSVGSVSDSIQSPFGFHILKVEKKQAAGIRPLLEVKSQIQHIVKANKEQAVFSAWIDSQLRSSKIMRNNDIIRGMTVETRKE